MTRSFMFSAAAALCFAVGCSKADRAPTTPPTDAAAPDTATPDAPHGHEHGGEHGGEHKGEHKHDHDFAGPTDAFHEAMAPLWHAPAGDARTTDTCAAAPDLVASAEAVAASAAPEKVTDEAAWKAAGAELVGKAQALQATCEASGDFDGAFTAVHEAFHGLVKLVGHEEAEG